MTHTSSSGKHRAGVAGAILLAVLPGGLAAQVPAPGDHEAALRRADSYYEELLDIMVDAFHARDRNDLPAFERHVRSYRVTTVLATVWHARACWPVDHRERNVAFVMQATMGEIAVGWAAAQLTMSTAVGRDLMRKRNLADLLTHAAKIREVRAEMRVRCGGSR